MLRLEMMEGAESERMAVHHWNCAQLLKRKSRSIKMKVFGLWKDATEQAIDLELDRLNEQIAKMNQQMNSMYMTTTKSNPPTSATNEQLRLQLNKLKEEQKQLEEETDVVKEELENLKKQSYSRTRYETRVSFY